LTICGLAAVIRCYHDQGSDAALKFFFKGRAMTNAPSPLFPADNPAVTTHINLLQGIIIGSRATRPPARRGVSR